jgi:hypothetical protein
MSAWADGGDEFLDDSALLSVDLGMLEQTQPQVLETQAMGTQADPALLAKVAQLEKQLNYKAAEATNLRSNIAEVRRTRRFCCDCAVWPVRSDARSRQPHLHS